MVKIVLLDSKKSFQITKLMKWAVNYKIIWSCYPELVLQLW